ncbi:hypothetical protein TIFTF001_037599 [Ficus carica]|uniref:Uncharacterized protein n=1 Tax=Ficus carica TaxID=3494 RepID=A0AA88JDS6_FICCA|nr:hypothetical protein TIFTF001_037599 [Ficus carica]
MVVGDDCSRWKRGEGLESKGKTDEAQRPSVAHDGGESILSSELQQPLSDIADKVNHLLEISDTRWWSLAGQTVKQGISRYAFC